MLLHDKKVITVVEIIEDLADCNLTVSEVGELKLSCDSILTLITGLEHLS